MCRTCECLETARIVENQMQEIVSQLENAVTVADAVIKCPCNWHYRITNMYHCLYCKVYFCTSCAENHFGQTVDEYLRKRNPQLENRK
jgi:hypothetical protein